jgi:ABC-2 type transport system permease protein
MKNIWTIARRDFRSYFMSPVAYLVIAGFTAIMGWMFYMSLAYFHQMSMQYQQFNMGKGASITDQIIRPVFGNMNVVFLLLVPFITMRLFAEERRNQTIQLLLTSPVTTLEIVLGKFLSAFLLVAVMVGTTLFYPIILALTGNPDFGPIFGSYLGTLLMASCVLVIGMVYSAMSENQIIAGALSFATGLFFWLISWAQSTAGGTWGEIFGYLSLISHYNNFSMGVINTSDLTYYLSFIFFGIFMTHRVLDSYRWR